MIETAPKSVEIQKAKTTPVDFTDLTYPEILVGRKKNWKMIRMWMSVSFFIICKYKNPIHFFKIIKRVKDLKRRYTVENNYPKLAFVDGRVFFNCNNNGWPAKHFNRLIDIEARTAIHGNVSNLENLRLVLIAFTKKCPLQCEHCYEGPELNKKDTLTLDDHKKILKKLQDVGISMIHYGGGDPMAKVNDLVELLDSSEKTADFWIFTSGFNFTEENAFRLKKVGLTGVAISLDHHVPELHNKFRRHPEAFHWVEQAAANALKAKLVITLSICATKEFTSEENLMKYLLLAKKLGASFIQILEPRAIGNYAGKNIYLSAEQDKIIENFFLDVNQNPKYRDLPIVLYPAYHQRKSGCPGAGSKYIYVDTDGYMSNCPFCQNKKTHILDDNHNEMLGELRNDGCGKFDTLN